MLLKPLKRLPVPDSETDELVEPSAGLASAFVMKLRDFPKVDEDHVEAQYFSGLRALICLYDNGNPFLPQLINSLHAESPEQWEVQVQEDLSIRQTLDEVEAPYLVRIVDYFLDNLTVGQMQEINLLIRTKLWVEKELTKN